MSHLDPFHPPSKRELRDFGLLVGGAFLAIAAFALWRDRLAVVTGTLGALGALLMAAGALIPSGLAVPYRVWMQFAVLLSKVTTPIFMAVVYFVVLTPIGLVMRAFGKDSLRTRTRGSRWVIRSGAASSLERQF